MKNSVFLGVCENLGKRFKIDPILFRIVFIIFGIGSFGAAILIYFLLFFFMR